MVSNICIGFSIIVLLFALRCARKGLVLPVMASTCACLCAIMIIYPVAESEEQLHGADAPLSLSSFERHYGRFFAAKEQTPVKEDLQI